MIQPQSLASCKPDILTTFVIIPLRLGRKTTALKVSEDDLNDSDFFDVTGCDIEPHATTSKHWMRRKGQRRRILLNLFDPQWKFDQHILDVRNKLIDVTTTFSNFLGYSTQGVTTHVT
jgi:hypothetical protein